MTGHISDVSCHGEAAGQADGSVNIAIIIFTASVPGMKDKLPYALGAEAGPPDVSLQFTGTCPNSALDGFAHVCTSTPDNSDTPYTDHGLSSTVLAASVHTSYLCSSAYNDATATWNLTRDESNTEGNVPATTAAKAACSDGVDNDGDTLVDRQDPGCSGSSDGDESNHFVSAVCGTAKHDLTRQTIPNDPDIAKGSPACLVLVSNPTAQELLQVAVQGGKDITEIFGSEVAVGLGSKAGPAIVKKSLNSAGQKLLSNLIPELAAGFKTYNTIGLVSKAAQYNAYGTALAIWLDSIKGKDACLAFWVSTSDGTAEIGSYPVQNPTHLASKDYRLGIAGVYYHEKGGFGGKWVHLLTALQCGSQGQTILAGTSRDTDAIFSSVHTFSFDGHP